MEEIWKTIKDFEDYQVSNFGRVKSLKFGKERILKYGTDKGGYRFVFLSKCSKLSFKMIHQLVAIEFLNHVPCGYKLVVNHIDLNKQNNYLDNLELITQRQNCSVKLPKHSSKYTGVNWCKHKLRWISEIKINGKKKYLGTFKNEIDAHNAYQDKLKQLI